MGLRDSIRRFLDGESAIHAWDTPTFVSRVVLESFRDVLPAGFLAFRKGLGIQVVERSAPQIVVLEVQLKRPRRVGGWFGDKPAVFEVRRFFHPPKTGSASEVEAEILRAFA